MKRSRICSLAWPCAACALALVLPGLSGCTSREDDAAPGAALYHSAVVHAVSEQNKGDAAAGEERGALQPAASRAVSEKDAAIQEFIRRDRATPGMAASNSVYVFWTEQSGAFLTDPPRRTDASAAMEDAYLVYWGDTEKRFMQSPLAKGEALKSGLRDGWWFVLLRDDSVSYVFWCDACKTCHKEGWRVSASSELAPVAVVQPAGHLAPARDGGAVPEVASAPKSEKDVAMLAFIRQDRAAATNAVYVYWTEDYGEFRTDPPPDASATDRAAGEYLVFWSAEDQRFMQTPLSGSERRRSGLQKGWWVVLSPRDTISYVYWCAGCKACHKTAWRLRDSPDTVPVAIPDAAGPGHAAPSGSAGAG